MILNCSIIYCDLQKKIKKIQYMEFLLLLDSYFSLSLVIPVMRLIEVNVWSNGDNTMEVDLTMTSTAWDYRLQQSVRDHRQYLVAMLNMEPIGNFSKVLSLVQFLVHYYSKNCASTIHQGLVLKSSDPAYIS